MVVDHDDGTAHCSSLSPGWGMTAPTCAGPTGRMAPLRCLVAIGIPDDEQHVASELRQLGMDVLLSGDAVHVAGWFDVVVVTGPLPSHVRAAVVVRFQISAEAWQLPGDGSVTVESTSALMELLSAHPAVRLGRPSSGAVSSTLAPPPAVERMTREPPSCSARCSIERRPKPRWPTVVRSNP